MSESDVQVLRTEFLGFGKRLAEQFDRELGDVKNWLKAIEEDVHKLSNRQPGIGIRVDRLENSQKSAKEDIKN